METGRSYDGRDWMIAWNGEGKPETGKNACRPVA